jgi:hypothetical protein
MLNWVEFYWYNLLSNSYWNRSRREVASTENNSAFPGQNFRNRTKNLCV